MRISEIMGNNKNIEHLSLTIILEEILQKPREWIAINQDYSLNRKEQKKLQSHIQELKESTPLAYLTGKKEFYGLTFRVDSFTLIPRPETEILVDIALDAISKRAQHSLNILEVGTGSGCIPISILFEMNKLGIPNISTISNFDSIDTSKEATIVAKENAQNLLGESTSTKLGISSGRVTDLGFSRKYNIIISNPPYIPTSEYNNLQKNVRKYEPKLALDGGEDGLDVYREILEGTKDKITKDALYIFEIHENMAKALSELVTKYYPNCDVTIHQDYSGKDRVAVIHTNCESK